MIKREITNDIGFKMVYNGDEEEEVIDLNDEDLQDCFDDIEKIQSQIDNGGFNK